MEYTTKQIAEIARKTIGALERLKVYSIDDINFQARSESGNKRYVVEGKEQIEFSEVPSAEGTLVSIVGYLVPTNFTGLMFDIPLRFRIHPQLKYSLVLLNVRESLKDYYLFSRDKDIKQARLFFPGGFFDSYNELKRLATLK